MPKERKRIPNPALRIIDANLNRCREALRVVEDVFRLGFPEAEAAKKMKEMRHRLAAVGGDISPDGLALLDARDAAGDVGRGVRAAKQKRAYSELAEAASANIKRAQEAARVLEETARMVSPGLAPALERLRFEMYEFERGFLPRLSRRSRLENVLLYALVTSAISPHPVPEMVKALIDGGADMIQLREKVLPDGEFARNAEKVAAVCRRGGALFIVNDRPDIAAAVGADGVHLGQEDLPPAHGRRVLGECGIVGVSTRSMEMARKAAAGGADYVAIGPVFESRIAPDKEPIGLKTAKAVTEGVDAAVFAIGGISENTIGAALEGGCRRVAVCTALLWAENPADMAKNLKRALLAKATESRV